MRMYRHRAYSVISVMSNNTATETLSQFDSEMRTWFDPSTKKKDIISYYDGFAGQFKTFTGSYIGPRILCENLEPHVRGKTGLKVLDVGAGTGFLATELVPAPSRLDALEPSVEMLEVARGAGLYDNYYTEFMEGLNSTSVPNGEYDLVASAGAFIPNHIPLEGLYEFNRITKTGGLIAIIMREHYLREFAGYSAWYPTLDRLEQEGVWERKVRLPSVDGYHDQHRGAVFIYTKLREM